MDSKPTTIESTKNAATATEVEPRGTGGMSLTPETAAPRTPAQREQDEVLRLRGGLGYSPP